MAGGAASGVVAHRLGLAGPLLVNAVVVAMAAVLWLVLDSAVRPGAGGGHPPANVR